MKSTIVFAGPSLAVSDYADNPGIEFHPPVQEGDMIKATDNGAKLVGIIDGYFGDRRAVSHKEILYALSKGVIVYGAASMGALRAAELDSYGMIGVGKIYEDYRSGVLTDDGDVAITHGPADLGFVATSLALVDVFATLRSFVARKRISKGKAAELSQIARSQFFAQRSWDTIAAAGFADRDEAAEMAKLFVEGMVEAKRLDALLLLERLAEASSQGVQFAKPVPPRTVSFLHDLQRARTDMDMWRAKCG